MSSTHHSPPFPEEPAGSPLAKAWAVVRSRWRQEPLHPQAPQHPLAKFHGPPSPPRQGYRPGKSDSVLIAWSILCGIPVVLLFMVNTPDNIVGAIGASFIVFLIWVGPAFLLTIIYLIARAGRRRCPACGTHVPTGRTQCAGCGHDFAAAAVA